MIVYTLRGKNDPLFSFLSSPLSLSQFLLLPAGSRESPTVPIWDASSLPADWLVKISIFIGPESDHWQPLSLTNSLTHSFLVDLIDVTVPIWDATSLPADLVMAICLRWKISSFQTHQEVLPSALLPFLCFTCLKLSWVTVNFLRNWFPLQANTSPKSW